MKTILNASAMIALTAVVFCVSACSTSQISVNKKELKKIKTIAIMKFEIEPGLDARLAKESEESYRGHFIKIGKSVVEREKLDSVIKEIEKGQTGLISNPIEIGKFSGAQALLFGSVTENKEEVRRVKYNEYDKHTKKNVEKEKDMKFFTFQVLVRLVSTTDAKTILTMKNKYPEKDFEMTDSTTLARFRERVLTQMGDDLKNELKEK